MKLIYLILQFFFAWTFLNFLASYAFISYQLFTYFFLQQQAREATPSVASTVMEEGPPQQVR